MTRKTIASLLALALFAGAAAAQQPELASKPPGVDVGKKAPKFELPDQFGKKQSLEGLLKEKNVAIVFYRSGSW